MHQVLEAIPTHTMMARGSLWHMPVGDALGPEASARIAADIMAIAQGVATTPRAQDPGDLGFCRG